LIFFFKKYFEKSNTQKKLFVLISFDGVESTTDLVLYLFYRYFKNSDLWSKLKTVTLDSCRYITDFGIEILNEAVSNSHKSQNKITNLINKRTCAGCSKILKYFHSIEEKIDLFGLNSFTKTIESPDPKLKSSALPLNIMKILVLNDTINFKLTKYIETKQIFNNKETKTKSIFDYFQYKFEKPANDGVSFTTFTFNLIEIDVVI